MPSIDIASIPDAQLTDTLMRTRRLLDTATRDGRADVAGTCNELIDELSAELAVRCRQGRFVYATEPTEQGNQYVMPGCERDPTKGPSQIDLF